MTATALNPPRLAPRGPAGSVDYSANYSRQQSVRHRFRLQLPLRPLQSLPHRPRRLRHPHRFRRQNDAARALSAIPL
ncbi:MAG TPA: hypothetical protein PKA59_11965 [Chakrabartia sp.]|nr:hypothetical protein [Chakrabartia sp.]